MDINLDSTMALSNFNNNFFNINPIILLIITCVVIVYFIIFSSLGNKGNLSVQTDEKSSIGLIILETGLWAIFISLVLLNALYYLFDIDVMATINNMFQQKTDIDIQINRNDNDNDNNITTSSREQVYHISDNKFTYDDARALCKASGGRLATYKDLEDAYNNGADWCSYGWSEDQLALYPTQYDKWQNLQKIPGHENDCGRPGINGGFIDNKNVRFGVNCYGNKRKIKKKESQLMNETPMYPLTQKEINFNKKVEYWKDRLPDILVAPFNNNNWNMV